MSLRDITREALEIRELYEQLEIKMYGRAWNAEEITLGFVGDVGDLAKLIQAQEGVRDIADYREKLGHELSDCLWSILVLAAHCDVDLEVEFSKLMRELKDHVSNQLST